MRPLGSKGSNPYKSCSYRVGLLSVVANVPFCEPSNWQHSSPPMKHPRYIACRASSSPPPSSTRSPACASFRFYVFLLFLGRNMIFHQKQNGRTFPYRAVRPVAYIIKFFRNFYAIHRTKRTCKALTFESQKASQVFSNDRSLNLRAYLQTSATAFAYPCSLVFLTLRISTT